MFDTPSNINASTKNGTMAQYGNDALIYAEFSHEAVLDQFATDETGMPVYRDVEMVTIITPGNNKSTFVHKATPEYQHRFKTQWEHFKAGTEAQHDGLPLTEWPLVTKAQALNLRNSKIFTVEQLAAIIDQNIDILGLGGRDLRDKAKAYLDRAVGAAEISKLFARVNKLEADNLAKEEQIKQLIEEKNETRIDRKTLKLKES